MTLFSDRVTLSAWAEGAYHEVFATGEPNVHESLGVTLFDHRVTLFGLGVTLVRLRVTVFDHRVTFSALGVTFFDYRVTLSA